MTEKDKWIARRVFWLIIVVLLIFIPIIISETNKDVELIDEEVSIEKYYSSIDTTELYISLTFDKIVGSGYATITFYDESENFLATQKVYFLSYNSQTVSESSIFVDGKADLYEIESLEFEPDYGIMFLLSFGLVPFAILMLIFALLYSYKEIVYNGKKISVYAGKFHHNLRIDGVKVDEHNTLFYLTPIKLSTTLDNEEKIDVTISLASRISLKVNDRLLKWYN